MEKHRNVWLILAVAMSGVASALLARPDTDYYSAIFYGLAVVLFVFAVRQRRFPFLRGSEAALLYRELLKLHRQIGDVTDPTKAEADEIVGATLKSYRKYAPHYLHDPQAAIDRAADQGPSVTLAYLRQGIQATLERLEMGGGV
jgi:hypothetical protein